MRFGRVLNLVQVKAVTGRVGHTKECVRLSSSDGGGKSSAWWESCEVVKVKLSLSLGLQ